LGSGKKTLKKYLTATTVKMAGLFISRDWGSGYLSAGRSYSGIKERSGPKASRISGAYFTSPCQLNKMKNDILIFDDDQEILMVIKIILGKKNYRVETKVCCDDILEIIKEVQPRIILMDLWVPPAGGENAIVMIKNDKDISHIPIILFSANAQIGEICKRVNANGFLAKPFNIPDLFELIQTHILKEDAIIPQH
jgi:CheY-like chemotaxis protein